jgi:glycerophosphoryl diester phosphodiesterase
MVYADITAFDCGRIHPAFPAQQRVTACKPLLSTVFTAVDSYMAAAGTNGRMIYNLELKSWPDKDDVFHPAPDHYAALVIRLVEAAGLLDRVRIQSFDYRVIREAWKLNPGLCYGLLIEEPDSIDRFAQQLGFLPRYVNPHFSLVDRHMADSLQELHIGMIPWTVNRPEEMLTMKRFGAEGIITDFPELALAMAELQV